MSSETRALMYHKQKLLSNIDKNFKEYDNKIDSTINNACSRLVNIS